MEGSEQFALKRQRHLTDLIQEECPAVGRLKQSALGIVRAGERPLDMPEQLALKQGLRNRAAVDGDERLERPLAVAVNDARDDLLAGPGFAVQANGGVGVSHARHLLKQRLHFHAAGHDVLDPCQLFRKRL